VQQWEIKINSAYPRFPGQNDAQHLDPARKQRVRIVKKVPRWHAANLGSPIKDSEWPNNGENDHVEMQLDGQLGAFFHILHGGHNGDGQIKLTAPGVCITQWFGVAGKSQYVASKAALEGLASSWAIELASSQITVNVVAPGPIETSMLADPARSATPPKLPPLGRCVQPEEVADQVTFLLGPSGCSITGQRLVICAWASL
jgi:NAD(P)-dependent dehydrogenase (short-subunit alcohol dehydrogenase family)